MLFIGRGPSRMIRLSPSQRATVQSSRNQDSFTCERQRSTHGVGWQDPFSLPPPQPREPSPLAWGRAAAASWLDSDPACFPPARATRGVATEGWGCAINLNGCLRPRAHRKAWQVMVEAGGTPFEEGLCDHSQQLG